MKRLALIHTVTFLADMFRKKLAVKYPDLDNFHVVDGSILPELMKSGNIFPSAVVRRLATQARLAFDAGAEVILFTCSSTSPAVDIIQPMFDVPILKIDDPLAEKAVQIGDKIGVICTAKTTLLPCQNLIREHATRQGKDIHIIVHLESGAFEAITAGDLSRHDELVKRVAREMGRKCDVIVLTQASMAHLASELQESLGIPVLSSPDLCVEALYRFLVD